VTKFCKSVDIQDVITCATFCDDRLRGSGVARGRISRFPIDLRRRPYSLRYSLPCKCVTSKNYKVHGHTTQRIGSELVVLELQLVSDCVPHRLGQTSCLLLLNTIKAIVIKQKNAWLVSKPLLYCNFERSFIVLLTSCLIPSALHKPLC